MEFPEAEGATASPMEAAPNVLLLEPNAVAARFATSIRAIDLGQDESGYERFLQQDERDADAVDGRSSAKTPDSNGQPAERIQAVVLVSLALPQQETAVHRTPKCAGIHRRRASVTRVRGAPRGRATEPQRTQGVAAKTRSDDVLFPREQRARNSNGRVLARSSLLVALHRKLADRFVIRG